MEELNHPLVIHFMHMLEYVKNVDPILFKRASDFAHDKTGIEIEPDSFDSQPK